MLAVVVTQRAAGFAERHAKRTRRHLFIGLVRNVHDLRQSNHRRAPQQTKPTKQTHHADNTTKKAAYTQSVPITNTSKTETETESANLTLAGPIDHEQPGAVISPRPIRGSNQALVAARLQAVRAKNRYCWTVTGDRPNVQKRRS
jgi:hypothetical protein